MEVGINRALHVTWNQGIETVDPTSRAIHTSWNQGIETATPTSRSIYGTWNCIDDWYEVELICQYIYSGGTIDLSDDWRRITINQVSDNQKKTLANDTYDKRIRGVSDFTLSYSGLSQAGGTLLEDALAAGAKGTVVIGQYGSSVTFGKFTYPVISQGAQVNSVYDTLSELNVTFNGNGTATYSFY